MMTKNLIDSVSMILTLYIHSGLYISDFAVAVRAHNMSGAFRSDQHEVSVRMFYMRVIQK